MILGSERIKERLEQREIFRQGTWIDSSIKEASYALRVADDGMVLGGKIYEPGKDFHSKRFIEIEPGRIAILSTVERLCMPSDLVGKLGVRLDFASKGLTGLMGIQVDPYYGQNHTDERLFIKVANFGNETVRFSPGATVFNIEFSEVSHSSNPCKPSTWERIIESLENQENSDWTYMTKVDIDARGAESRVIRDVDSIREGHQSVVMFGIFLVAITILGVMITLMLNVKDAPNWVANAGWIAFITLFSLATLAIVWFIVVAGAIFWKSSKNRTDRSG